MASANSRGDRKEWMPEAGFALGLGTAVAREIVGNAISVPGGGGSGDMSSDVLVVPNVGGGLEMSTMDAGGGTGVVMTSFATGGLNLSGITGSGAVGGTLGRGGFTIPPGGGAGGVGVGGNEGGITGADAG